ncbi:mannan-binding lectin serine protease 1-like [Mytilus trossulus]|uniref:mannan-binding lectin serine protease 1-like n=1 Tax=Mytilus trossulus TaxID=6551 RepID=UPI003007D527
MTYWQVFCYAVLLIKGGRSKEVIDITTETNVEVFSTNYPRPYPSEEDKEWRMSQEYGKWQIILVDFQLQNSIGCSKDYLEINEENSQPKRLCGRKSKQSIISIGSKVRLHFHSDDQDEARGFRLTVKRLMDDDDMKKKSKDEAANVSVINRMEESWMFRVLLGALGCAVLVFTVLITLLCLEMRKKRLDHRPDRFNISSFTDGGLHWPPRTRSDSKSYGRQNSNSSTAPLTQNGRFAF